ncbi:transcriptional regulator [bacterium]|nr:transcriptional regulator [bacterium]
MRNMQVSRIYKILTLLESARQGMSVKEIHERIQKHDPVSDRTIRRDIEALEAAGFPIQRIPDDNEPLSGGRFRIDTTVKVAKHLTLSPRELFALYMGRGMLTPLRDTALFKDLDRVFDQIDTLLPQGAKERLDDLSKEVSFEPGPKWGLGIAPDLLDTVLSACSNSQVLEFDYQSPSKGEKRRRRLGPHFMYFSKGALYLVAEDLDEEVLKTYSMARASDALVTEEAYDREQENPEEYFRASFGVYRADKAVPVEIQLSKEVVAFTTERRWHDSQRVVKMADGSAILHLEVGITPDLVNFVLSFGPTAVVKAPEELSRLVVVGARRILALYRS